MPLRTEQQHTPDEESRTAGTWAGDKAAQHLRACGIGFVSLLLFLFLLWFVARFSHLERRGQVSPTSPLGSSRTTP